MPSAIDAIRDAILHDASGEEIATLELPTEVRGALVRAEDAEMFGDLPDDDRDPRKALRVEPFPLPELAPDEAYVAVMASAINFNTVWTSIFRPLPTFGFLQRLGRESYWGKRHDLPYHVVGSDASGVVLRVGNAVRNWKPGDRVTVQCNHVDDQDPSAHDDSMLATNQRIWGFETNFGGLAEVCVVKANQLMPKPQHLTWEEAAVNGLCNSTSYRMIVSKNGAHTQQGDSVLVWGASGGIGAYAVQYVLNGGGTPVGVCSSEKRAELLREMGCKAVIDRKAEGYRFWKSDTEQDPKEWLRLGKKIRELIGRDVDTVFEHPGRQTMGASVFVAKRGGLIITCAATSGFMIEYDNRYLWMNLKTLKGCHFANYREAWEANRLICDARIHPTLSRVYSLDQTGEAAYAVHKNMSEGKLGVLCLAPGEGLGVTDEATREAHLDQITLFRRFENQ
jgi:crotonyl-CoA reductase